jgi:hypothetical protein
MRVYSSLRLGHSGLYTEVTRLKGVDFASTTAPLRQQVWQRASIHEEKEGWLYLANYYAVIL